MWRRALLEIQDGSLTRFRCRTGHAFTSEGLLAEQSEALERSLWFALKILDKRVSLARQLAQRAVALGREQLAQSFIQRMHEAEAHAGSVRSILEQTSHHVEQTESRVLPQE